MSESNSNNTSLILFRYPTYILYGRLKKSDVETYEKTLDDSLIIYKYCINERSVSIPDYKHIWDNTHKRIINEYKTKRLAQGYKTI